MAGVLFAGVGSGCSDADEGRYSYHVSQRSRTFGDDQRVTATISPGRVANTCPDDVDADICLWGSGPFPGFRIANGRDRTSNLVVHLSNVGENPIFSSVQTRLFDSEEQAQPCIEQANASPVELSQVAGRNVTLSIPPCRALVLKQELPESQQDYRMAVAGSFKLNEEELDAFFEMIAEMSPRIDSVAILGNIDIEPASNDAATLRTGVRQSAVPVFVGLGPREIELGFTDYIDRFGAMNYVTSIGTARLLTVDTSTRTLSENQVNFINRIKRDACNEACPEGVVLTWASPLGPTNAQRRGWTSEFVAQSMIAAFDQRGFDTIIASAFGPSPTQRLGEVRSITLDDAEQLDDLAILSFLGLQRDLQPCFDPRIPSSNSVLYPDEDTLSCDDDQLCVAGYCHDPCGLRTDCTADGFACFENNYCRLNCSTDANCPGESTCEQGWCAPGAQIEFIR